LFNAFKVLTLFFIFPYPFTIAGIYHTSRKKKHPEENNPHGKYPWEKTWKNIPSPHRKIW